MAGMRAVEPRVSYAELARWPDDGRRYELYDGEPILVPAPNFSHQIVLMRLSAFLWPHARDRGGVVLAAPFDIVLSPHDVLQPDFVYFGAEKRKQLDPAEAAYVVPDLAVEVLSRSTERRDRGRKMELLARHGLPEYWLVDGAWRAVEVYLNGPGGALALAGIHHDRDAFDSPALALRIDVAKIFED